MSRPQQSLDDIRNSVEQTGKDLDFEMDSVLAIELPEGKFSGTMMSKLVDSLNQFATLLDIAPIDIITNDTNRIPEQALKMLMALAAAAEDSGNDLNMDLTEVVADRDLAMIIGQLDDLSKNEAFREFLASPISDEEAVEGDFEEEEMVMEDEIPVEMDEMEDTFARRL
jgi:hypothetical protein